jgi:hypothetical protein
VRAAGVVDDGERVEQGLQLSEGGGLGCLGAEPVLQRLLEAFDFPLGLGMVRLSVLLLHAEAAQFGFQGVAAALAAGETGGEDQAVVGERGCRGTVADRRRAEGGEYRRPADPDVSGD